MAKEKKSIDLQLKEAKLKRWKIAAKHEAYECELKALKVQEKQHNLCRIDTALDSFDEFMREIVSFARSLPDLCQNATKCSPEAYLKMQELVDNFLLRLKDKRLYLSIEDTQTQKDRATQKWYESMGKE